MTGDGWRDGSAFTNWGPYADDRAAQADAELRLPSVDMAAGQPSEYYRRRIRDAKADFIRINLAGLGVTELHDFDDRIVVWLSTWEESTLQVILGWVARAYIARSPDDYGK